jgi:hypothetical protein
VLVGHDHVLHVMAAADLLAQPAAMMTKFVSQEEITIVSAVVLRERK